MKKTTIIILAMILISFIIAIYFYSSMPDQMASHWNSQGEVDSYMSKFWGLFLMPLVSILIFLVFLLIPKIDPLKKNIEKFRKYFDWFIVVIIAFLLYIYLLTIFWNLDYRFNMTKMLMPALGILFYYAGILLNNSKRSWFIGVRTPWTLSSDIVWDKTNKLGGQLFKIIGIITVIAGLFVSKYLIWIILVPILTIVLYLFVYSYFEYQKVEK